jgi:DNA (cytosine-5)-methyltransferase 1
MYRTPTASDTGEKSFEYAAKILNGKTVRKSNEKVQKTLSMDVAMEYLKDNPELIQQLDQPFKVRPNLPNKIDFINYLKSQTNIRELTDKTDIKKTTIEHWFRKDNSFAYPTVENWNTIKKLFNQLKYDYEMTHEVEEDWKS